MDIVKYIEYNYIHSLELKFKGLVPKADAASERQTHKAKSRSVQASIAVYPVPWISVRQRML